MIDGLLGLGLMAAAISSSPRWKIRKRGPQAIWVLEPVDLVFHGAARAVRGTISIAQIRPGEDTWQVMFFGDRGMQYELGRFSSRTVAIREADRFFRNGVSA